MTEKRHLCGNCRECLKEEVRLQKIYIEQLRGALGYSVPGHIRENPEIVNGIAEALCNDIEGLKRKIEKLSKHLAEIDRLIEKRKMLTHESFYSIDLRKLIELRSKQNDNNS